MRGGKHLDLLAELHARDVGFIDPQFGQQHGGIGQHHQVRADDIGGAGNDGFARLDVDRDHQAVDRRGEQGALQAIARQLALGLRLRQGLLAGLDRDARDLVLALQLLEAVLPDQTALAQGALALQLAREVGQPRTPRADLDLGRTHAGIGRVQIGLEGFLVEPHQQVAALHALAFLDQHFSNAAGDFRAQLDLGLVDQVAGGQRGVVERAALHFGHVDLRRLLATARTGPEHQTEAGSDGESDERLAHGDQPFASTMASHGP